MSNSPGTANNDSPSPEYNNSNEKSEQQSPENGPSIDTEANAAPAPSPRKIHGIARALVVLSTLSCILLYALDNTITANLIPVIANDFSNTSKLAWLAVGFRVGGVSLVLPFGKLYGLFNAKTLYIGSVTLFMVGSAVCGAAPNVDAFIIGRVIAGAGGNGMYLGVMTLLSVTSTNKERPIYLSLVGLIFGIGTVVGPVIGGAFAESSATWRWGFYINLCVGGLFAPVYIFLLPGFDPRGFDPKGPQKLADRFNEFDYVGAVLSVATLVCVIMATNFGGALYAWNSGRIVALFVLAGVFAIAFAVQQSRNLLTTESHRMFPVQFLRMKEPMLLFISMAAANAGGFIAIYYIPTYFAFVRGDNPMESAVRLLPLIVFISTVILVNGAMIAKLGLYQPWYLAGGALVLIGGVLMYRVDMYTSTAKIYGYQVLLGIGTGAYIQAGYGVIQAIIKPSNRAYAISFMMLAQLLGITLGLSISGAVFLNKAISGLGKVLPDVSRDEVQNAVLGASGGLFNALPTDVRKNAIKVIVDAIDRTYVLYSPLEEVLLFTLLIFCFASLIS
ncbi:MAG: hypothetical protein M1835_004801 [Candelina submexicana]|nr:MAG: hypothetical protein M1835_004801 [Candelina submexicana]